MATTDTHEAGQRIRWLVFLRAIEDGYNGSPHPTGREETLALTADSQLEAEWEARQLIRRRVTGGERITGWQLVALPRKELVRETGGEA